MAQVPPSYAKGVMAVASAWDCATACSTWHSLRYICFFTKYTKP